MDRGRLGILRCAVAAVLFGATTPIAARLAEDTPAPVLAGLLYLGAALAVLPVLGRRPLPRVVRGGDLSRMAVAVLVGGLLGPLLLTAGLARTHAATASLLLNLELVATTILAVLLFGEHVGRRVVGGTVLVVAAGVALAWSGAPELRLGALLIALACVCWGLDNGVTADLGEVAPEHITFAKGVIAGGTNLTIGLLIGGALPGAGATATALLVGALGYGASITLWVGGARDIGAARGQLVFAAAPFFGVVVAWVAFGDDVRGVEVLALVLASAGVLAVLGSDHLHEHEHLELLHDHEHRHDDAHHDHVHDDLPPGVRHAHAHRHRGLVHAHAHLPDLHHRHPHPTR